MSTIPDTEGKLAIAICPECGKHSILDPCWLGAEYIMVPCEVCDIDGDFRKHKVKTFVPDGTEERAAQPDEHSGVGAGVYL